MNYSFNNINWPNFLFIASTTLAALIGVPWYIMTYGWGDSVIWSMAFFYYIATGLSITLGYHRLFSHKSFSAKWPVKLGTLMFGAAAFENSAMSWAADHRRHHKHCDHDDDPYNALEGFFHSHVGWIIFKNSDPDYSYVRDLQKDKLVAWQERNYVLIGALVGFAVPAFIGWSWNGMAGALGGFFIAGVGRLVMVHHFTFLINSLCHTLGSQPYSNKSTARDSAITALLTFGEGYHNFHHTFQHDYRNGVKFYHFDPTKWMILLLSKIGLTGNLRRVPDEKIQQSRAKHQQEKLDEKMSARSIQLPVSVQDQLNAAKDKLEEAYRHWEELEAEYAKAMNRKIKESKDKIHELQVEFAVAQERFREAFDEWKRSHQLALTQFA
ncbi:MAG: acyl-CoA desaturase [Verrucomicrobiales bacterium]|nr:acyl-CoA desaturase [Verrucomicrobiales bacterium]|tara:strand:+ start:3322 stop:4467 length:1146 start_codon:yes stop_codon:yes gene_type:complete